MSSQSPLSIQYSNEKLRILVEEYITQQRTEFTFKSVCSFIAFWAMEDKSPGALYESNELQLSDQERISRILENIVADGRIAKLPGDAKGYIKK